MLMMHLTCGLIVWAPATQVWRNHLGIIEALLEAGADVDAQDGESGW